MLETIREFASECLDQSGEAAQTRGRHARWFLELGEQAEPELTGAGQGVWLQRLDAEHDNIREAVGWASTHQPQLAVALVGAVWRYWHLRGLLREGWSHLEHALAATRSDPALERTKLLYGAAVVLHRLGDYDRAEEFAAERLAISRARGDPKLLASSLLCLGLMVHSKGDHERAVALYTEGADLARKEGDKVVLAMTLANLGILAQNQGDEDTARSRYEEALALYRENSDTHNIAGSLGNLAELARTQGRIEEAKALTHEALGLAHGLGDKEIIIGCLEDFGEQAASEGQADRAARLLGASEALREDTGHAPQFQQRPWARIMALLDAEFDPEHLAAARAEGHAMTLDEAVAYALEPAD
jgi:tetratricopeptide (TPR) repeat protein